jgi:exosortase A-associated hydrolase 2
MSVALRQEAFQLSVAGSERLCVWRAPMRGNLRARIVHVPAFAEEMNKSRHLTAEAARRLAEQGFGVLQIDLLGCGDSTGDFGDASFEDWIGDIVAAIEWTVDVSDAPLWLWALRGGTPLAAEVAKADSAVKGMLLWQPVLSGRMHLTQFLRLKLVSDVLGSTRVEPGARDIRDTLRQGSSVEVAGYRISPRMAASIDRTEFECPATVDSIVWLEVASTAIPTLGPKSAATIDSLLARGIRVDARAVNGPAFWQTVEIEHAPALVDATVATMTEAFDHVRARDPVLP